MLTRYLLTLSIFIFFGISAKSQSNTCLDLIIEPLPLHINTIHNTLLHLQNEYKLNLSYSSSQFNAQAAIIPLSDATSIGEVLRHIFYQYDLTITTTNDCKIILATKIKKIRVYGYIEDALSGENLIGITILDTNTGETYGTNDQGFFIFTIQKEEVELEIRYLGYETQKLKIINQGKNEYHIIKLKFNNELAAIEVKEDAADHLLYDPGSYLVTPELNFGNKGLSGNNDLLNQIKSLDGINSGAEGEIGLYVNGGTSDQNLFLLDGMPIYETSHLAGINSIFIEESIRSVNFIKSGIPARYGGRLSSVLNVNLKEGHKEKREKSFSISPVDLKLSFQGPLLDSTNTFNFAARQSILNTTISPLAPYFTNFEEVKISYGDILGKITHQINPKSKFSLLGYGGGDQIQLINDDNISIENLTYKSLDVNKVNWSNKVFSAKYTQVLNSKASLNAQVGYMQYIFNSRGSYYLFASDLIDTTSRVLDVQSYSSITDLQSKVDYDYYLSNNMKLKVGAQYTYHRFNPTIIQSTLINAEPPSSSVNNDSTIQAQEYSLYAEANIKSNSFLYLYPGLHFNNFVVEGKIYPTLQPRLTAIITPSSKTVISASYSRLAQNIKLLSNPGIGIASDLWVPSTREFGPTLSTQFDLEFKQVLNQSFFLTANWYNKSFTNLIEFNDPIDLHANVVIQNDNTVFYSNPSDWRNNVSIGNGKATGYSFSIRKETGKYQGYISYHKTNVNRTFPELNDGNTFLAKNDRPHDINIGMRAELNTKWKLNAIWVYTSGSTFTLPNEGFESPLGIELVQASSRNNFRLPAFHQLTIFAEKKLSFWNKSSILTFGLYNAYDRRNPFYLYATNRPGSPIPVIRKVSILPVFPLVNFKMVW